MGYSAASKLLNFFSILSLPQGMLEIKTFSIPLHWWPLWFHLYDVVEFRLSEFRALNLFHHLVVHPLVIRQIVHFISLPQICGLIHILADWLHWFQWVLDWAPHAESLCLWHCKTVFLKNCVPDICHYDCLFLLGYVLPLYILFILYIFTPFYCLCSLRKNWMIFLRVEREQQQKMDRLFSGAENREREDTCPSGWNQSKV